MWIVETKNIYLQKDMKELLNERLYWVTEAETKASLDMNSGLQLSMLMSAE